MKLGAGSPGVRKVVASMCRADVISSGLDVFFLYGAKGQTRPDIFGKIYRTGGTRSSGRCRDIRSTSRSGPIVSPLSQLRSAASIRARLCRQPTGGRAPDRPVRQDRQDARFGRPQPFASYRELRFRSGPARGPGGRLSSASLIWPDRKQFRIFFTISAHVYYVISGRYRDIAHHFSA